MFCVALIISFARRAGSDASRRDGTKIIIIIIIITHRRRPFITVPRTRYTAFTVSAVTAGAVTVDSRSRTSGARAETRSPFRISIGCFYRTVGTASRLVAAVVLTIP